MDKIPTWIHLIVFISVALSANYFWLRACSNLKGSFTNLRFKILLGFNGFPKKEWFTPKGRLYQFFAVLIMILWGFYIFIFLPFIID